MRRRMKKVVRDPVVAILPFLALLISGWLFYMHGLNAPSHADHNLIHSSSNGSLPEGWHVKGSLKYNLSQAKGYDGGEAFGVETATSGNGSVVFYSNIGFVRPGRTYLYKAYHLSQAPFSLIIKYFHQDGGSDVHLVRQYGTSDRWTTDSYAFRTDASTTGVQVLYDFSNKGKVWLDRPYLEERTQGVYVPSPLSLDNNLVTNSDVKQAEEGTPVGWESRQAGNNDAQFSYVTKDGQAYLNAKIHQLKNGNAIWAAAPVPTSFGRYYAVAATYRSTAAAQLEAIYTLDSREVSIPIASLPPSPEWTTVYATTEAPPQATAIRIAGVLGAKGSLDLDNFRLSDNTKPGSRHFRRPLVSVIFDDGWSSTYDTASRIMDFLNYKATYFVSPGSVGQGPYLQEAQIRQLLQNGDQLGSSSYEQVDLTTLNAGQLDRQLRLASGYVKANWQQSQVDFLPPYDRSDAEVESAVHNYFRSSISGGEGLNTKQNFDVFNLKAMHIDKNISLKHFAEALQEANDNDGWLILAYDRVEDNSKSTSAVTPKQFSDQMQQIYDSQIPVVTISSALEEEWGE